MCYLINGFRKHRSLLPAGKSSSDFAHMMPVEKPRMPGDAGYAICICGGQGDCLGCEELETQAILKVWQ